MAGVIKSQDLDKQSSVALPVAFNVQDIQSRTRQHLEDAKREAKEILEAAKNEAAAIKAAAEQEGMLEAQKKIDEQIRLTATEMSDQRCRTAIAACETTVDNLIIETANWLAKWRDQTVELAGRIAEKIVRREMVDNTDLLRGWLEEALVTVRESRDIQAHVHPDDFAIAGRFMQQIAKSIPQAAAVEIVPNPEVGAGGCVVKSNDGTIDFQLESQLDRLVEQLS